MKILKDNDVMYYAGATSIVDDLELSITRNGEKLFVLLPKKDLPYLAVKDETPFCNRLKNNMFIVRNMFKKLDDAKANPKKADGILKDIQKMMVHEFGVSLCKTETHGAQEKADEEEKKYKKYLRIAGGCAVLMGISATVGFDGTGGLSSPLHWYTNTYLTNIVTFAMTGWAGAKALYQREKVIDSKIKLKTEQDISSMNDSIRLAVNSAYEKNQSTSLRRLKNEFGFEDVKVQAKTIQHEFSEHNKVLSMG